MSVDIAAAERFVFATARLLDRHRLAVLLHGAPVAPVIDALGAYRNPDGGWTFDSLDWSPGQSVERRGMETLHALTTLGAHGRIEPSRHR